jgi:hypothetical protein
MTRILAGTARGLYVLGGDAERGLPDRAVTALASDGAATWATLDRRAIWQHAGGAWQHIIAATDFEAACLLPDPAGLLVGTFAAHLFRLVGNALERIAAFDAAAGRASWYTPWGGPPETRSLARDAGGALYANVHVGGIVRSRDGGASWQPTIDIRSDVHQVVAHPIQPGTLYAATGRGLAASNDGGDTWTFETAGLHGRYLRGVAIANDTLLLSASTGDSSRQAAVYRRPLAGGTLERCRDGLPDWFPENIETHCLAAAGPTAAIGTAAGEVYVSRDAGVTWELVAQGLPGVRCVVVREPAPP